jgi:plasmid maintenance system killer protein
MELSISDKRLRKVAHDPAACQREYGVNVSRKIALRLAALGAADSLADFWPPKSGPERWHELRGERRGTFSVDLNQPYRLLFRADEPPAEDVLDEQQRWRAITSIDITGIEDTHG